MLLRPLQPADLDDLVELCAEHAAYEGGTYASEGKARRLEPLLFGPTPALFGIGVERRGGLVGFATWMPQLSTWDAAWYVHLDCLYLRPEARGQGLGRRLVAAVVRAAADAGYARMEWQTPTANASAIRFYDRLGARVKAKARFYLDGDAWHRLRVADEPSVAVT
ncbi:MAG: GNAT family N-acetyltransferase [Bacteroidota bacterium]